VHLLCVTALEVVTPFPLFLSSSHAVFDIDGRMREGTPAIAEPEKTEYEIRRDLNVAFVRDAAKRAQGAAEDL
jgi:hypothetical protein